MKNSLRPSYSLRVVNLSQNPAPSSSTLLRFMAIRILKNISPPPLAAATCTCSHLRDGDWWRGASLGRRTRRRVCMSIMLNAKELSEEAIDVTDKRKTKAE